MSLVSSENRHWVDEREIIVESKETTKIEKWLKQWFGPMEIITVVLIIAKSWGVLRCSWWYIVLFYGGFLCTLFFFGLRKERKKDIIIGNAITYSLVDKRIKRLEKRMKELENSKEEFEEKI